MKVSRTLKPASLAVLAILLVLSASAQVTPLKISVFSTVNQNVPPADNKIYKLMEKELGVTFEWDIAVGSPEQKIGVMIASGDYPDLVSVNGNKFINAKALVPLDDLVEKYAPNIKKHYANVWYKMKEADGHVYCLPNWGVIDNRDTSTYFGDSALWIQKQVLKEFNYPKITTLDEYFALIEKYKAKHPTIDGKPTIGFSILTYGDLAFCLINPPNFLAGNPNNGNCMVNNSDYSTQTFLNKDIAKRWYQKLNEANAKGLIDKESFVDNLDQYLTKLASGRVLGIHDQRWQFQEAMYSLDNQGKSWQTMVPLPITFDKSIKPWYRNRPLPNLQRGYGISIKAKDPVAIIKFLDAQLSEKWQKRFQWGIEGEDYQLDKKGVPFRTPEQRKQQEDLVWKLKNKAELWFSDAPKMEGAFSDGNPTSMGSIPSEALAVLKPSDKEVLSAYGVSNYAELMDPNPPENPVYYPAWQIIPPDGTPAQMAWKKAQDTYHKWLPRVIMAKPDQFDKLWTQYAEAISKINLKSYEEYVHNGIMDRVKKWSKYEQ